jgi:hypothetical protein
MPARPRALEDVWGDALVLRRWQRLALRLSEADCGRIVAAAEHRGLAGGLRWLPRDLAMDGWAMETKGYVASRSRAASASDRRVAAPPLTMPSTRRAREVLVLPA